MWTATIQIHASCLLGPAYGYPYSYSYHCERSPSLLSGRAWSAVPVLTKTLIPAIRKKTFCHVERVDWWAVMAAATIGPRIEPKLATVTTTPMIFPACAGTRSIWLVTRQLNNIPLKNSIKNRFVTARARLQPTNPRRIRQQSTSSSPATQELLRTTLVVSLPDDRSQSATAPVMGVDISDPVIVTAENTPLLAMLTPKTSCK